MRARGLIILGVTLLVVLWAFSAGAVSKAAEAQIRSVAGPMLENILKALAEDDYEAYIRDMDESMVKTHTPEVFEARRQIFEEKIGLFVSKEFVKLEGQDGRYIVQYAAFFTKEQQADVRLRLFITRQGDAYKVSDLWFDSPALSKP